VSALKARLRTPRGQLELMAFTFGLAAVMAIVMAANRPFFERYVREKYPEVSAETAGLAENLEAGDPLPQLTDAQVDALYQHWMSLPTDDAVGRRLVELHPERMVLRVETTLLAGSTDQRLRALELVEASGDARFVPVLQFAADRPSPQGVEAALSRTLQGLASEDR